MALCYLNTHKPKIAKLRRRRNCRNLLTRRNRILIRSRLCSKRIKKPISILERFRLVQLLSKATPAPQTSAFTAIPFQILHQNLKFRSHHRRCSNLHTALNCNKIILSMIRLGPLLVPASHSNQIQTMVIIYSKDRCHKYRMLRIGRVNPTTKE